MSTAKYLGRDNELSTTGRDPEGRAIPPWEVTRKILEALGEVECFDGKVWTREVGRDGGGRDGGGRDGGHSTGGWGGGLHSSPWSVDCLRHWPPNGQCYYSDMSHVEACTASTRHPRRLAAQCLSTLRVVEEARRMAVDDSPRGTTLTLSTSNADALDPAISWGTHLNVSVSPDLFADLITEPRRPAVLASVSSALAAATAFFGVGHILPFRDGSTVYSLSGRAHHLSRIVSHSTTEDFRRGLLNSRKEPHGKGHDRLHLISFDFNLASAALLGSFLQCMLAAAEEGFCGLSLLDPIRALRTWSWNLDLRSGRLPATAALVDGRSLTLPAYMRELASTYLEMVESGLIGDAIAPDAAEMLARIEVLTRRAEEGDIERCAAHLDWAAKLLSLIALCRDEGVPFGGPAARLADHDFATSDPDRGMFWRLWEEGCIDPLVDPSDVDECLVDGPPESRDWGRGRIIRRFCGEITDVDWSLLEIRRSRDRWDPRLRIELSRLDTLSRSRFEPVIGRVRNVGELEAALEGEPPPVTREADPILDVRSRLASAPPVAESGSSPGSGTGHRPAST